MTKKTETAGGSIRRHVLTVSAVGFFVVVGFGSWVAIAELSGAVVASGSLVVDTNVKKVQHPTGGVVGELRVRDGIRVRAGDIVIRLDETVTRANLAIVVKGIDEIFARQARLEAERDDWPEVQFPSELTSRLHNPDVRRLVEGEQKLFDFRKSARTGQKAQMKERIGQLREEVKGLTEQAEAKSGEIELILRELEGVRHLWSKNLIPIMRLTQLERESVRLRGERGQLIASTAQAHGKMTETELQIIQVDQDLRSEVSKELREIQGKMAELLERRVAAEDQLMRIDIRAPQSGIVHQLTVHTVGGVITASEPAMLIVPSADQLAVEVKIQPQDIDNVRLEQKAVLRFAAFNQRVTPEIDGQVSRVSADVSQDPKSGMSYYAARIQVAEDQKARLGGVRLVPGMPVEAFLQISERSVLSYLTKPLTDQIAKAWRER